jgi:hypothetical protein
MDWGEGTFGNISGHRRMTLAELPGREIVVVRTGSIVVLGGPFLG